MIASSAVHARLERLGTMADIAEVAKVAAKFNYRMLLHRDEDGNSVAELSRDEPDWLMSDLARLAYLEAMATGRSVDDVLADVREKLVQMKAPVDVPPGDRPGIGEGGP